MQTLGISNNVSKLHQALGKRLYADEYSFISEICQNAVDSHRMSGQKDPVEVGIKFKSPNWVFYVKDTGLSFESKEDFVAKICTILESGKTGEKTNSEDCPMGMHGIGSISVSKFHNTWDYTVVKNGRKFLATLQETEGIGLQYECSDYEETKEDKYVLFEVVVPQLKLNNLIENMTKKLCYFKDIFFSFESTLMTHHKHLLTLNASFKLFQTDDIQLSTLSKNKEMHICLDQYSYPIRWADLGIKPIYLNIGLRFGMGDGLEADITRENLNFNAQYKDIILTKIKKVSEWIIEKYNKTYPDQFESYIDVCNEISRRNTSVHIEGFNFDTREIEHLSSVKIKEIKFKDVSREVLMKFMKMSARPSKNLCETKFYISSSGKKMVKDSKYAQWRAVDKSSSYLIDGNISSNLMNYIKESKRNCVFYTQKHIPLKDKKNNFCYHSFLNLRGVHKSKWRQEIKEFQILEKCCIREEMSLTSSIKIPDTFKEPVKMIKKKLKGEVGIKYPSRSNGWQWECKFVESIFDINDLYKQPFLHVYGSEKDRSKLDTLYKWTSLNPKNKIKPCMIIESKHKNIKELKLHNFMEIEEFFKGKHDTFRKLITAYMINAELISQKQQIFKDEQLIRDYVSRDFAKDLTLLKEYTTRYDYGKMYGSYAPTSGFMQDLVKLAHDSKLYDLEIWHTFQNVKKEIDKFDFVSFFSPIVQPGYSPVAKQIGIEALQDICKQRKVRMNWENYKLND